MSDLLCRYCREPWDMDCFDDEATERRNWDPNDTSTPNTVAREFARLGCGALHEFMGTVAGEKCLEARNADPLYGMLLDAAMELNGGVVDEAALEVSDYLGSWR